MKKLPLPEFGFDDVLDSCAEGMLQRNVKTRFLNTKGQFIREASMYEQLGAEGTLCNYPRLDGLTNATVVIPPLTKSKLVNLYEGNLRNKEKPARNVYESLLVSTNEKCPFCGDIGHPRNLDHFLPLAHFPQFSVMPLNLIPACRDCNMGEKGDDFALNASEQILHPYLDSDIFFDHQWVYARYINEGDGGIEYFVCPPESWNEVDKQRVIKHFDDFDLARRYGVEAGKHLSELIDQRDSFYRVMGRRIPIDELKDDFVEVTFTSLISNNSFINHWKVVMYIALSSSDEFLNPT